jgi:hypothetical protein
MQRSLTNRIARLEAAQPAANGLYGVHIGDTDSVTCDGQDIPLDEWRRRYPGATTVDIGGPESGDVRMAEL